MSADDLGPSLDYVALAGKIVSTYAANNSVCSAELPNLIVQIHDSLRSLRQASEPVPNTVEKPTPAQIRKSVTHEAIISFEDGRPYKTLRRHLTLRGLSPEVYRAKWGLPIGYPMTSASYCETRFKVAHELGLGRQRKKPADVEAAPAPFKAAKGRARGKGATAEAAE